MVCGYMLEVNVEYTTVYDRRYEAGQLQLCTTMYATPTAPNPCKVIEVTQTILGIPVPGTTKRYVVFYWFQTFSKTIARQVEVGPPFYNPADACRQAANEAYNLCRDDANTQKDQFMTQLKSQYPNKYIRVGILNLPMAPTNPVCDQRGGARSWN